MFDMGFAGRLVVCPGATGAPSVLGCKLALSRILVCMVRSHLKGNMRGCTGVVLMFVGCFRMVLVDVETTAVWVGCPLLLSNRRAVLFRANQSGSGQTKYIDACLFCDMVVCWRHHMSPCFLSHLCAGGICCVVAMGYILFLNNSANFGLPVRAPASLLVG